MVSLLIGLCVFASTDLCVQIGPTDWCDPCAQTVGRLATDPLCVQPGACRMSWTSSGSCGGAAGYLLSSLRARRERFESNLDAPVDLDGGARGAGARPHPRRHAERLSLAPGGLRLLQLGHAKSVYSTRLPWHVLRSVPQTVKSSYKARFTMPQPTPIWELNSHLGVELPPRSCAAFSGLPLHSHSANAPRPLGILARPRATRRDLPRPAATRRDLAATLRDLDATSMRPRCDLDATSCARCRERWIEL